MANTVWGIHTMNDNLFLNNNVIAIGWKSFGNLTVLDATREAFKAHYVASFSSSGVSDFFLLLITENTTTEDTAMIIHASISTKYSVS